MTCDIVYNNIENRVIRYAENHLYLRPHPLLRDVVAHYTLLFPKEACPRPLKGEGAGRALPQHAWEQGSAKAGTQGPSFTILPDISGCMVFELGTGRAVFWGATTKAVTLARDFEKPVLRFFVEFQPGGAHLLTGLPMDELTDRMVPMDAVVPQLWLRIFETVAGLETGLLDDCLNRVDHLLWQAMANRDASTAASLLPFLAQGGSTAVKQLASHTGYSERQLNRIFRQTLGVPAKGCAKFIRFNKVVGLMRPGVSLAQLAQEAGYFDQPHLNRDFKEVCGVSPGVYLATMSDFYKEDYKL